jgi:hypothetical protein
MENTVVEYGGIEMTINTLSEDLDLFVEHESLRVRYMERMENLASKMDRLDGLERKAAEKELRSLDRKITRLDKADLKRIDRLLKGASDLKDERLLAQLQALRSRYGGEQKGPLPLLDLDGLSKALRQRITRGVSTMMLCGAIAMGIGQAAPAKISLASSGLSNREEIHEMANIPDLFDWPVNERRF